MSLQCGANANHVNAGSIKVVVATTEDQSRSVRGCVGLFADSDPPTLFADVPAMWGKQMRTMSMRDRSRSWSRPPRIRSRSVRGCVGLFADSDLTPTLPRRHRGYARRRRPAIGNIRSGGKQQQDSGGVAGTARRAARLPTRRHRSPGRPRWRQGGVSHQHRRRGRPPPPDSVKKGCSPNIRAFTQPSTRPNTGIGRFLETGYGDGTLIQQGRAPSAPSVWLRTDESSSRFGRTRC